MNDVNIEAEVQKRREYHRKWRAEHPESVRAAQERYWTRRIERKQQLTISADVETRTEEQ